MDLLEYIKDKRAEIIDNTEQYRIMLEPKFRDLSNKINDRIRNTLNNPRIMNIALIDKSHLLRQKLSVSNALVKDAYKNINSILGQEIYIGKWNIVDQSCINGFADLTGDRQWIHTDVEKARKESPFKTTIAHGFLTLSLIPKLTDKFNFNNIHPKVKMVVNYGLNRVRFPIPVKAKSRIRGRLKIIRAIPMKNSIELVNEVSIEVDGRKRFGCLAETVIRIYF